MASTGAQVVVTQGEPIPLKKRMLMFCSIYWRSILVTLTPIILLPLPIIKNQPQFKCLYVVLLMAVYWVTEALPLPVTSMIPVVLFPTMGILGSEATCKAYMKGTNMMFIGGLMIAAGLQHSKLHKRVALKTIQIVGCSHRRLTFGLCFVTMFISMWISNAAATTMMVPITEAVLEVLEQQGLGDMYIRKKKDAEGQNGKSNEVEEAEPKPAEDEEPPQPSKTTICYFLLIAYSASLGGTGTLVGTATNLTFKGIFEGYFPNAPQIDFPKFMLFQVPPMLLQTFLVWVCLQVLYMGMFRPNSEDAKKTNLGERGAQVAKKVVDEQYVALGPMTWHETSAGMLFILAVFLFFLRSPGFIQGWADVLTTTQVKDAVTAMLIVILMFVIPANLDFLQFFFYKPVPVTETSKSPSRLDEAEKREAADNGAPEASNLMPAQTVMTVPTLPTKPSPGIVTWKLLKDKIPWGLLFLLGGGFALADGSKHSGMSSMIGDSLIPLKVLPPSVILLIIVIICELLTEFTSNVAIANIILPVLAEMCVLMEIHPLYMMLPAAIACSMAFHMPVGTPPNAIVAGVVNIRTSSMAVAGIAPTILTALITWGSFPLWGLLIYPEVTTFPDWAIKKNATA